MLLPILFPSEILTTPVYQTSYQSFLLIGHHDFVVFDVDKNIFQHFLRKKRTC